VHWLDGTTYTAGGPEDELGACCRERDVQEHAPAKGWVGRIPPCYCYNRELW
jgi:hypothetical protein